MSFRSANDKDFQEIARLANANGLLVEGLNTSEFITMMDWQYNLPPSGRGIQIIKESPVGEINAHYGAIPFQFIEHGYELMGALAGNLVINKASRQSGIFYKLQTEFAKKCEKEGYSFSYGFITRKGVLDPHLRIGWKSISDLYIYARPISSISILEKLLKNWLLILIAKFPLRVFDEILYLITNIEHSDIVIEQINEFDSSASQFLEDWNGGQEFTAKRSISILNWRFFSFKDRKYKVYVATRAGKKCGYMALRRMTLKNFTAIALVDLIVIKNDKEAYSALLGRCIQEARMSKVDLVATVVGGDNSLIRKMLFKGFIRTPEKFTIVVRGFKKNGFNLDAFKKLKWFITWFDQDTI
jgi:hypothetical protein